MSDVSESSSSRPGQASSSSGKRLLLLFLRLFIAGGLVVIAIALALRLHPPLFPWAVAVFGGSACSASDVYRGSQTRFALEQKKDVIQSQLRLVKEDPAGFELWAYEGGEVWIPKGSEGSLAVLIAQQEVNEYGDVERGARAGDVVLDCGAHVGLYTREALEAGAALVVAIEPAPANLECLRRNLAAEIAAEKVIVYPKGVWDKEDVLPLFEDPSNSAADRFLAPDATSVAKHTVPLVPIDFLVEELDLARVALIKMDIKGATVRALQGARQTLERDQPRLVISTEEEIDSLEEISGLIDILDPTYRRECGSCSLRGGMQVMPDVVFFRPPAS